MDDDSDHGVYFIDEMQNDYAGRVVTISRIDALGRYHIMQDMDMYTWVDPFFECLESDINSNMKEVSADDLLGILT